MGGIHFWTSVVFFSILALHLMLHWRWIVSVVTGRPSEGSGFRAGLGIVGLAAVVALAISPLLTPVKKELPNKKGIGRLAREPLTKVGFLGS